MGNFVTTAGTDANPPPGKNCIASGQTWKWQLYSAPIARADGSSYRNPQPTPPDSCITGLEFGAHPPTFFKSIKINTVQRQLNGLDAETRYPWIGYPDVGGSVLTPDVGNQSGSYDRQVGANRYDDYVTVDFQRGYALSAIDYHICPGCCNIYGLRRLRFKTINLKTFAISDWIDYPGTSGDPVVTATTCGCGGGGYSVYGQGSKDNAYVIQQFDVQFNRGTTGGTVDGLFNFLNVRLFDIKAFYSYAMNTKPSPLRTQQPRELGLYDMFFGSEFSKLAGGAYRDTLIEEYCTLSKKNDPKGIMDPACWCRHPEEAVASAENAIYIDTKLMRAASQGGQLTSAPPKCWATDCRLAWGGDCEGATCPPKPPIPASKFFFSTVDEKSVCPILPPINICSVSIDIWQSQDVQVVIDKLAIDCKFTQNNPPPQCVDPKYKDSPVCKAFQLDCSKPENKNKPECSKPAPPVPVDCSDPANRNKPECKPTPGPVDCTKPENRNLPECQATPVDCSDPDNANLPECSKGEPTFWETWRWWILGGIGFLLIVILLIWAVNRSQKKKATQATSQEGVELTNVQ